MYACTLLICTFFAFLQSPFEYAMLQVAFYKLENYPEVAKEYPFTDGVDNRDGISVSNQILAVDEVYMVVIILDTIISYTENFGKFDK